MRSLAERDLLVQAVGRDAPELEQTGDIGQIAELAGGQMPRDGGRADLQIALDHEGDLAARDARERGGVLAAVARRDQPLRLLRDEARHLHRQPEAIALGERDLQVLEVQLHLEAERIAAVDHVAGAVLEDPRARRAAAERLDERLQRQTLPLSQSEPFAERGVGARDQHLVDGFAGLPGTRAAEVRDRAAERLERRARECHVRVLTADERRELSLARALGAARDRRIDRAGAALGQLGRDAARGVGRDRGAVQHDGAALDALGDAACTEDDRLDVGRIRDAQTDELGAPCRLGRRRRTRRSPRGQGFLALARPVVHRQFVTGVEQVTRHRLTHRAESDPCNLHAGQANGFGYDSCREEETRSFRDALGKILGMATSVEERRTQFRWMDKLSDEDVTAVTLTEPGTELADLDEYVDATSPKRGRVISLEGERVPVGGVYIVKSASPPELWERIGEAIR